MRAVILAGGKGERLRPLTENTRKAFLPLGGKRVVDHIIDRLPKGTAFHRVYNDYCPILSFLCVFKEKK